jgi:hypothetical protein
MYVGLYCTIPDFVQLDKQVTNISSGLLTLFWVFCIDQRMWSELRVAGIGCTKVMARILLCPYCYSYVLSMGILHRLTEGIRVKVCKCCRY